MRSVKWEQVRARRLAESYLAEPAVPDHLAEVVSRVCGLQAQVLSAAELGIGVRVAEITRRDVEASLWKERSLTKTYGPRGTIHLLPAAEMPLWIAANQAVLDREGHPWHTDYGLDAVQMDNLLNAMRESLDGRRLTRAELAEEVSRNVGAWAKDRLASTWADLIGAGFDAGLLCFGPNRGAQVTFARLDQWIGPFNPLRPDDALGTVCRRYFRAYGPATPRDFAQWFAPRYLRPDAARRLVESIAEDLDEVEVDGRRCWLSAGEDATNWDLDRPSIHLLPQYDCYLLGSRFGREAIIPEVARTHISTYKNGRFEGAVGVPVLLVDGVVSGVWERKQRSKRIEIRVEVFVPLTPAHRQLLDQAVQRLGRFLDKSASMSTDDSPGSRISTPG